MATSDLVKELCKQKNVSISELARMIGQSRQNLNKKINRDTLTLEELSQIADALGARFEQAFIFPDGSVISTAKAITNNLSNTEYE